MANACAGPFGTFYDFYIERPWLVGLIGRAVWGMKGSVLYKSMRPIGEAAPGSTIADVPCGGGVAFRALRPGQDVRYLAGDLDPKMLQRAERRARTRSLGQIECVTADMTELPFGDAEIDLFLSYSGLHMISEPQRAIEEIARCLKPGGRVIGTAFFSGDRAATHLRRLQRQQAIGASWWAYRHRARSQDHIESPVSGGRGNRIDLCRPAGLPRSQLDPLA